MATRYWKSTVSGASLILASNWTGSGALTSDDLIIDLSGTPAAVAAGVPTGVAGTIASGILSCNSLTVVDTALKPVTMTGTSTMAIGSTGGSYLTQQFITTANTVWNHTGVITLQGNSSFPLLISTGGGVIQAPITVGNASFASGTYKTTGVFKTAKTLTLTYGTLDVSANDLYCGIFSSNAAAGTRGVAFGTAGKGIYLDNTATAVLFLMSGNVTGFSYTGTSRIVVTNSGTGTTKTITSSGYNGSTSNPVLFNFYFSDVNKTNSNVIVVTSGGWFLDFDATNWNTAGSFTNSARTIYGNLNLCSGTTWTGTTTSYITTFTNAAKTSAQIVNYNGATGVGPLTFTANNVAYPINITSTITSIGAVIFGGSTTINLIGFIGIYCTTVTHTGAVVNTGNANNATNPGSISATTYTLTSGILNIVNNYYGIINTTGAFTLSSAATITFPDNANQVLSCFNFICNGGLLSGTTSLPAYNLATQIEVLGRISANTIAINAQPTVIGNIGFYVDYTGVSAITVLDNTGILNYTFNTGPLSLAGCNFKGLDLSYQTNTVAVPNASTINVNGSFFDDSATVYKIGTASSTNSTATLYLNGGTSAAPFKFDMNSTSALAVNINGARTPLYGSTFITTGTITVNNGTYLDLNSCDVTAAYFIANGAVTILHSDTTFIKLTGLGSSTGLSVFYAPNATLIGDGASGSIVLAAAGAVTTNIRNLQFPVSKCIDSFNVEYNTLVANPSDRVNIYGTCNILDLTGCTSRIDIQGAKCAGFIGIGSGGVLTGLTINAFSDETASFNYRGGTVELGATNLTNYIIHLYGTGDTPIDLSYTSTAPFSLYLHDSAYATVPGVNFNNLSINNYSTFNSTTSATPNIVISAGGQYLCAATATLVDLHSVTFTTGGNFYTGGKHYGTLNTTNAYPIYLYDSNALIDTYLAKFVLYVYGDNTTITNIIGDSRAGDTSIYLLNSTGPSTFTFSTITDLVNSNFGFYLNTSENTLYPVTVKFNTKLKVGPNSGRYVANPNIVKVAAGYTVYNFYNYGTYTFDVGYDPAKINYVYTGVAGGNFFLMF